MRSIAFSVCGVAVLVAGLWAAGDSANPKGDSIPVAVQNGARWIASVQGRDGGWGQDGGETSYVRKGENLESNGNDVANTAVAALALRRAGKQYQPAVQRAVDFILRNVENSPQEGIAVTQVSGTQIQRKLGPNIDTFLTSMLLSEIDSTMPTATENARVRKALEKCVAKIERNQQKDGSWNAAGGVVSGRAMAAATPAAAGVPLYQSAQALEQLSRTEKDRKENAPQIAAIKSQLANERFVDGFGSMGGEEFFSYLNISDSLRRTGGEEWTKWHAQITARILKLQNEDGTWAGHHCITGRVATTGAAILNLTVERGAAN